MVSPQADDGPEFSPHLPASYASTHEQDRLQMLYASSALSTRTQPRAAQMQTDPLEFTASHVSSPGLHRCRLTPMDSLPLTCGLPLTWYNLKDREMPRSEMSGTWSSRGVLCVAVRRVFILDHRGLASPLDGRPALIQLPTTRVVTWEMAVQEILQGRLKHRRPQHLAQNNDKSRRQIP